MMASKRIMIDFVDNDSYDETKMEASFHSDSEDEEFDLDEYLKFKAEYNSKLERQSNLTKKKDLEYEKRIREQLANSGAALDGKLNWCTFKQPEIVDSTKDDSEFPSIHTPIHNRSPEKPQKRFGKSRPMDINIRVSDTSAMKIGSPPKEASYTHPTSFRTCKYILSKQDCPFGKSCKFSHTVNRRQETSTSSDVISSLYKLRMCENLPNCKLGNRCKYAHSEFEAKNAISTCTMGVETRTAGIERKSKKIWMCKNLPNCNFRDRCIYAHSELEVKKAVSACNMGDKCKRVIRQQVKQNMFIYISVPGERKCMRLHPHEHICNFIQRTSN